MATIKDLKIEVSNFYGQHKGLFTAPNPQVEHWNNLCNSVPGFNHCGCYALCDGIGDDNDKVVYIGLGIGNTLSKLYPFHGLSARLMSHVVEVDKVTNCSVIRAEWQNNNCGNVNQIYTIPIYNNQYFYLAASMEVYLICKLCPPCNKKQYCVCNCNSNSSKNSG